MFSVEQSVGGIIAWPTKNCVISDEQRVDPENSKPKSPSISMNKCILMDWDKNDEVVAEARWQSRDLRALVNRLPLGPKAVKVYVDVVLAPKAFLWRPITKMTNIEESLNSIACE